MTGYSNENNVITTDILCCGGKKEDNTFVVLIHLLVSCGSRPVVCVKPPVGDKASFTVGKSPAEDIDNMKIYTWPHG